MPELRAPENSRTGIEINPNVRYPDQTEDAIVSPSSFCARAARLAPRVASLDYTVNFGAYDFAAVIESESGAARGCERHIATGGGYPGGSLVGRQLER